MFRRARPTYEQIADAIEEVLTVGLYEISMQQDGRPVDEPVLRLARMLERNGLIDARAFKE